MAIRGALDNPRLADASFSHFYKKYSPATITDKDYNGMVIESIEAGDYRAYVDGFNRQFLLLGTERGNVLVSRVNDRRNGVSGQWCYRVLYSTNGMGSFTKVKQNSSVTGDQLAKILGYECDNLHQRFVIKNNDVNKRFPW